MIAMERYFRMLAKLNASDLHLAAGRVASYRASGKVQEVEGEAPLEDATLREMLAEVVDKKDWNAFSHEHDLDFAYQLEGVGRFRGNYYEQGNGVGCVFRLIPEEIIPYEKLGLPDIVSTLSDLDSGLVLVTGPTGSGKSTTLASIVDLINRKHARHIVTIEDPVEFVHQNKKSVLSHREVGKHTDSFASALKAAIREDADVVLVGEMRDHETISLAIEAAGMGILVFGTLHTSSAAKTIDRIIDAFPADQQDQVRGTLSESLYAVVAQVLCRRIGGGRIGIHEILIREKGLAGAIREAAPGSIASIIGAGRGRGMQTLDDALGDALKAGHIEGREAYMKANDKKRFQEFAEADSD
ncbi:MAG: PilT/PilU family type 4a pilus ATPase [Polyangiaceae bacterium]|nr:PilT/PilU family type 4a pilus ATPase [Polyangiaceae bacterium]